MARPHKKVRGPIDDEIIKEKYGEATNYACIPCREKGALIIVNIGEQNIRGWFNNQLTLKCPYCARVEPAYDANNETNWVPMHLPSVKNNLGEYFDVRLPEDWDPDLLVERVPDSRRGWKEQKKKAKKIRRKNR